MEPIEVSQTAYNKVINAFKGMVFFRSENGKFFLKPIGIKTGKLIESFLTRI
jgi:hypothetical protein